MHRELAERHHVPAAIGRLGARHLNSHHLLFDHIAQARVGRKVGIAGNLGKPAIVRDFTRPRREASPTCPTKRTHQPGIRPTEQAELERLSIGWLHSIANRRQHAIHHRRLAPTWARLSQRSVLICLPCM